MLILLSKKWRYLEKKGKIENNFNFCLAFWDFLIFIIFSHNIVSFRNLQVSVSLSNKYASVIFSEPYETTSANASKNLVTTPSPLSSVFGILFSYLSSQVNCSCRHFHSRAAIAKNFKIFTFSNCFANLSKTTYYKTLSLVSP